MQPAVIPIVTQKNSEQLTPTSDKGSDIRVDTEENEDNDSQEANIDDI